MVISCIAHDEHEGSANSAKDLAVKRFREHAQSVKTATLTDKNPQQNPVSKCLDYRSPEPNLTKS